MDLQPGDSMSSGGQDAPGAGDRPSPDINTNDPLVNMGLVDPVTGRALPTSDWQPTSAQPDQQPATPDAQTAGFQPTALTGLPAQPNTEIGRQFMTQATLLQAQAESAIAQAIAAGIDPNVARATVGAKLEAELAKAHSAAIQAALLPSAKIQVAQIISQRLGSGVVTPQDLMVYDSPQAMENAARQLAQARRASNFSQRQAAGVDRAEGTASAAGVSPAIAGLSPTKKIELGIRRGQY
jgi:hypothetical protein